MRLWVLAPFAAALWIAITSAQFGFDRAKGRAASMNLGVATLAQDDLTRMVQANQPLAMAVQAARNAWQSDPGGLVLAFSQAEISYYSGLPFISYFDPSCVQFYSAASVEDLWTRLRAHNVRFILAPPYPLAEITNTPFNALLADPRLTKVLYERHGARLLKLAEAPFAVVRETIASEGGGAPQRLSDWTIASFGPRGTEAPASKSAGSNGAITFFSPKDDIRDRGRVDTFYRGAPLEGALPAFKVGSGEYLLTVDLVGRGRTDLILVNLSADGATLVETPLWNGILTGKRRSAAARFTAPHTTVDADGNVPLGFALRTISNGDLTVLGWRLEKLQ